MTKLNNIKQPETPFPDAHCYRAVLPIITQFQDELVHFTTTRSYKIYGSLLQVLGICLEIQYLTSRFKQHLPDIADPSDALQRHMFICESKIRILLGNVTPDSSLFALYTHVLENLYSPKVCIAYCQKFIDALIERDITGRKKTPAQRAAFAKYRREWYNKNKSKNHSEPEMVTA